MKNTSIKRLGSRLYNMMPSFILKMPPFDRYIHHKMIPDHIRSFKIDGTNIRLMSADSPIIRSIYWLGTNGYEGRELLVWTKLCEVSMRIVEIGGNIGLYTIFGANASPIASYTVFEPVPYSFNVLKKNIRINGITNVTAVNSAVTSGISNRIKLFLPSQESYYKAPTGAFIANSEIDRSSDDSIYVNCISSKDVLAGCDLIKIDAEGAEYEILSSGMEIITLNRPAILLEVLDEAIRLKSLISNLITDHGYTLIYICDSGDLRLMKCDAPLQLSTKFTRRMRDVLLIPNNDERMGVFDIDMNLEAG